MTPSPRIPLLAGAAERLNCVPENSDYQNRMYLQLEDGPQDGLPCHAWLPIGQANWRDHDEYEQLQFRVDESVAIALYEHTIMLALMQPPHNWSFDFHGGEFRATGRGIVTAPTMAELLVKLTEGMR